MLCCAVHGFAILNLTFISLATLAWLGWAGISWAKKIRLHSASEARHGMAELVRLFR